MTCFICIFYLCIYWCYCLWFCSYFITDCLLFTWYRNWNRELWIVAGI